MSLTGSGLRERVVDVAVLGAGTAGLAACRAAEKGGASTLLIDRGPLGTTCARVGCMPSKLLVAVADAVHAAQAARRFGVSFEGPVVDGERLMARVRAKRDHFVKGVTDRIEELRQQELFLEGEGRFLDTTVLQVDGHTRVKAGAVVVATGAEPVIPEAYRDLGRVVMTVNDLFEMERLPESLLVVGTGATGMELGQALSRLKVRTTVIGVEEDLLSITDPTVKQTAQEIFQQEMDLHTTHRLRSIASHPQRGLTVRFTGAQERDREERFECVLVAAGIRPRVDGLDLDRAGISCDGNWRPHLDPDTLRLGDLPVFLAGDVNGVRPLLHEAEEEGTMAGANAAAYPSVTAAPWGRKVRLTIAFTDPQALQVGMPYDSLNPALHCLGEADFSAQGRAVLTGSNRGILRVYGDRESRRVVGAEGVLPGAEHLGHLLAWTIQSGMTVSEALALPFYHPVLEEGLRSALRNLQHGLDEAESAGADACEEYGPGT